MVFLYTIKVQNEPGESRQQKSTATVHHTFVPSILAK